MITILVEPGICGFRSEVQAWKVAGSGVGLVIKTDCEHVIELANQLTGLGVRGILRVPIHQNPVYEAAGRCRVHSSCPVPCGIIKAAEAALGLAQQKDVKIEFLKDDQGRNEVK
jgi:hypothetical protein